MNGKEALEILQHPRFGDERHIEALKICQQVAQLKDHRADGDEIDMLNLDEFYELDAIPKPEDLTGEQLEDEIGFWESARAWEL